MFHQYSLEEELTLTSPMLRQLLRIFTSSPSISMPLSHGYTCPVNDQLYGSELSWCEILLNMEPEHSGPRLELFHKWQG